MVAALAAALNLATAGENVAAYRCPGPPVIYTDKISASEAKSLNCKPIEEVAFDKLNQPPDARKRPLLQATKKTARVLGPPRSGNAGSWRYVEKKDELTDELLRFANLRSSNSLSLEFPHSGQNFGTLTLQTTKKGFKTYVYMEKGQVDCTDGGCYVLIRFDEQAVEQFLGFPAKGAENRYLFIEPTERFVGRLLAAKRIRIGVPVYQAGRQMFDFTNDASPEWHEAKAPKQVR